MQPSYTSIPIKNSKLFPEQIEQVHLTNKTTHFNLTQLYEEYSSLLKLGRQLRTSQSVKQLITQHPLKKSWATSCVIVEQIVPVSVPSPFNNSTNRQLTTSSMDQQHSSGDFRKKCSDWNKKANDQYYIYRVAEQVGQVCPALLFVKKDCCNVKPVPGQVFIIKHASFVKRKQKSDEYDALNDMMNNEDENSDTNQQQLNNKNKNNMSPLGILVNNSNSLIEVGTAANFAICKFVTYGEEYEDKQLYDALMSNPKDKNTKKRKRAPSLLADVLPCCVPVNTLNGEYCIHHYEKRVEQIGGTRMELSSSVFIRSKSLDQQQYTKPIVFLLGDDVQLFVDPLINTKNNRQKELDIENQKREKKQTNSKKKSGGVSVAVMERLATLQGSRGAQIIFSNEKRKIVDAVEKKIIKNNLKKGVHIASSRDLATQIVGKNTSVAVTIPKLGRGVDLSSKSASITFDLSSDEEEEDDDEEEETEPQQKKRKVQ
jgi:hypothetical protein